VRILVTGACGFVGRHVVSELIRAGHTPLAFDAAQPAGPPLPADVHIGDLRNASVLGKVVSELAPDACIHLAGIAFVPTGWSDPELVFSVNLLGTINVLEAFHVGAPRARMLIVTSAEVYGRVPGNHAFAEDAPLTPDNLYAVSKMAADLSSLLYARRYGMHVMTARPGNHIGPGQSPHFVTSAFAEQIGKIVKKQAEPVLKVGNLECERDFTDVRDVARAYRLIAEGGHPGEAYNISSEKLVKISAVLDELCLLAGVSPEIIVDPDRYRPLDARPRIDSSKIRKELGWEPQIELSTTLRDVLASMERRI
jgi:GDP-4-dehydro-6-deoxy-D-mannose reductase